jgi:hypothetical protein
MSASLKVNASEELAVGWRSDAEAVPQSTVAPTVRTPDTTPHEAAEQCSVGADLNTDTVRDNSYGSAGTSVANVTLAVTV